MNSEWRRRFGNPDAVGGLVTIGVCLFLEWQTLELPATSAIFPQMVLGLASILGVLMIAQGLAKSRAGDAPLRFFKNRRRFLIACGMTGVYVAGINTIGFYTSTAILVPAVSVVFGYRKPLAIAISTAVFIAGMALIFGAAMNYQFPPELLLRLIRGTGHV
ncbi:tripartite tricarboxylate transporter TctB family protein [Oleispirillum naphthae]|uniref:tripartite tricarboxylate transporter TctB family protein n=1 Tax=Oleispirillum naphthae TaxID=2838853 RepID=UPI0030822E04